MATQVETPDPGYFEFDDIIEKLPDMYHRFALSTVGAVEALLRHFDLAGSVVADIGAGTGRSSIALAAQAQHVIAVELQPGVVDYAVSLLARTGVDNVSYVRADSRLLPLGDKSVDHALTAWSVVDYEEAQRVTRSGGYIFQIGAGPANMCGELTALLAAEYAVPRPQEVSPSDFWYGDPASPWEAGDRQSGYHDVEYVADYGTVDEASKLWGRMYGPAAANYLNESQKSAVKFRLRISHYMVE